MQSKPFYYWTILYLVDFYIPNLKSHVKEIIWTSLYLANWDFYLKETKVLTSSASTVGGLNVYAKWNKNLNGAGSSGSNF